MQRAAKIYGYTVCVISVITFIISLSAVITAVLDTSEPLYAGYQDYTHLSSFENFKVDALKAISKDAAYIPDDATLRTMYKSARKETIAHSMHTIWRNLTVSGIILIFSVVLFTIHWMWMRRLGRAEQMTE
ncbi:MAG: hypothetical protein DRI69_05615 [Bacteroidetes bacterium]|nr:MAG: hypothetical protein DRI69_05615 [Bacteroidota bacterium]